VNASPTSPSDALFARSFDALAEGDRFATPAREVTDADVRAFAELTGDRHPLHVDDAFATAGPFGKRIAHGLLVLSMAAGLVPLDPRRVLALRRVSDAVFKRPVFPGESVHVDGRIASLRAVSEEAGLVGCQLTVLGPGERAVARATLELLWSR
jgi:acyl dehydratase